MMKAKSDNMEFICNKRKKDEKKSKDLIEINSLMKKLKKVDDIEISINDNNLQLNFIDGSIKQNGKILVDKVSSKSLPLSPKIFRRKTFVIGPHHDKITEKYFFGYIAKDGSEKYIVYDTSGFRITDKR